jgi:hypothetical protein
MAKRLGLGQAGPLYQPPPTPPPAADGEMRLVSEIAPWWFSGCSAELRYV